MPEVAHRINAPYDGISEVPPQVALPSTCREMHNCIARLPEGLSPRPPFEWRAKLTLADGKTISPDALLHVVPRGSPELDLLLLINRETDSNIPYLYDLATFTDRTADLTVTTEAQAYLDSGSDLGPRDDLRCATIEDTTFINNRRVPTANTSDTQTSRPNEAMIWVKVGGYGKSYRVTVTPATGSPVVVSYRPSNGGSSSTVPSAQTDRIAEGLYDGTNPPGGGETQSVGHLDDLVAAGFTVTRTGSLIYIAHASVDFTLTVSDDAGGTAMVAIKTAVQRFSDLPAVAQDGFVVKIAQSAAGGNSDYYVAFASKGSDLQGIWEEVVAPGANLGLDPETMPIVMTTSDDGATWDLDVGPWTGRTTGDSTLAPDPDFIGDTIQNVSWHSGGRLSLLASKVEYLSASDSPYKFYPTTLAVAKDSDALGLQSPLPSKAAFLDTAAFDRKLMILGNKVQGVIESTDKVATGSNTELSPLGSAPMSDQFRVQTAYGKAYWPAKKSSSLMIYELSVDRISGQTIPEDITPAIPTLLPLALNRATTCEALFTTVYGTSADDTLYVNCYRHVNGQREQNGWATWGIPNGWTLVDMFFYGTTLMVLLSDGIDFDPHMVSLDLAPGYHDPYGSSIIQYLDLRVHPEDAGTFDEDTGLTTFTSPCPIGGLAIATLMKDASEDYPEGYILPLDTTDDLEFTLIGDWSEIAADHIWLGVPYRASFIPHTWYMPGGQDGFPRYDGRLVIRKVTFEVSKFGTLNVDISVSGKDLATYKYEGYVLADPETAFGNVPVKATFEWSVSVQSKNTNVEVEVYSDSHLGFFMTAYEWRGQFSAQASRT